MDTMIIILSIITIITIIRCASTYTEEEASSLLDTADHIAHYECFLQLFELVGLFKRIIVILRRMSLKMIVLMITMEWLCKKWS